MNRPLIPFLLCGFVFSATAIAGAEKTSTHHNLSLAPTVRIVPTSMPLGSTAVDIGPRLWSVQGFDLRGLFARVYDVEPSRVEMQGDGELTTTEKGASAAPRFDLSMTLAGSESDEMIQQVLRRALEERFGLAASVAEGPVDVYVLRAPQGAGRGLRLAGAPLTHAINSESSEGEHSEIIIEGRICPGLSSAGISANRVSLEDLAAALASNLDRPVVDETHLSGKFEFRLAEYRSLEQLASLLQEELGVNLTPERRMIQTLQVRSLTTRIPELQAGLTGPASGSADGVLAIAK